MIKTVENFFNKVVQEIDKTYFPNVKYYMDNKHTAEIHRATELFNNGCLDYTELINRLSDATGDSKENIHNIVCKYVEGVNKVPQSGTPAFKYQFGGITVQGHNINELKEFSEHLGELAKESGMDISKHLNDVCFAIDVDYQNFHDLDDDEWGMVH